MKPEYKTMLILTIFVIILILLLAWALERGNKFKAESEQRGTVIDEKNAIIKFHVNDKGQTVADKEAAELRYKDLQKSYPEIYKALKDEMDVNYKRLKAFVQNEFAAHGSGTGSVTNNHYYDSASGKTIKFRDFHMSDGYLTFDTRLYDSLTSSLYTYVYADTAKTAIHGKKKWFLGSEKLYATTVFSNPQAKITGTTSILVNNYKDKRFSIGVSAGWGIVKVGTEVHTGWFVGPTVHYSLYKF
jgi:hypothetical protein